MWKKTDDDGWASWVMEGLVGIKTKIIDACEMRLANTINGSGSPAFGGAKKWPNITLEIGFQTGEDDYRDALAEELRKITEQFFADMVKKGRRDNG